MSTCPMLASSQNQNEDGVERLGAGRGTTTARSGGGPGRTRGVIARDLGVVVAPGIYVVLHSYYQPYWNLESCSDMSDMVVYILFHVF